MRRQRNHLKPILTIQIPSFKELFTMCVAILFCLTGAGASNGLIWANAEDDPAPEEIAYSVELPVPEPRYMYMSYSYEIPPDEELPVIMVEYDIVVEEVVDMEPTDTELPDEEQQIEDQQTEEPSEPEETIPEVPEEEELPVPEQEPREAIIPDQEPILPEEDVPFDLWEQFGSDSIQTPDGHILTRYNLPDVYHPGIDYSSIQTWMPYTTITDRSSAAYKVARSDNAYTDDLGFRRYTVDDTYFTVNGHEDDYMIALGTYYKPKGTCGDRWLIVTDNGYYTAITGDEKSDLHTDPNHQYKPYGKQANVIEFLIDKPSLCREVKSAGSATALDKFSGKILYMYRID